ncbi:MAG: zinc ABC transporter substrate-binding protein [Chloroflexi bacterium]|nr:zinc ABC transporter substrate-binding protein [Chloroflexota bacterium]
MRTMPRTAHWRLLALLALLAGACQGNRSPATPGEGAALSVVATTNIVADVVGRVGGHQIRLTALLGVGVDPHTYQPAPADAAAVHDAQVVFANGAGLEEFLEPLLKNAGGQAVVVHLSDGLMLRQMHEEDEHDAHDEAEGDEEGHQHEGGDPHVWFDVQNVIVWVQAVQGALSQLDPAYSAAYQANAQAYIAELEALDAWIVEQVAQVPPGRRTLVTNHPAFGYFADRYGFRQVGAVYPINPGAEPSAQDIARLQGEIRQYGVPAIFSENTVNPKMAQQVAKDTGVRLAPLYSGSLGGPDSGAATYVEMMRRNVQAIVEALR